jgi:hypothetical protein
MVDGYSIAETELEKKYNAMQALLDEQRSVNSQMTKLHDEMAIMPKVPNNMEHWIDSVSDLDGYDNFKMADYGKMFSFKRRYERLLEKKENINRLLKLAVIDNLLERIEKESK